jgi:thiamine-monophosphate kinase
VQLRDVSEFALIARIERIQRRARRPAGGTVALGIGDDAALLRVRKGEQVAVSTDAFVEGVHFRFTNESPRTIGRRALAAAVSDLAAMGARPLGCVVALAVPPSLLLRRFDGIAAGIIAEAARQRAPVCGGNLTRARETQICVTAIGAVRPGRAMLRAGTAAGDRVLVTGTLGGAALERARAERGRARVRRVPQPRLAAGRRLASVPGLVACIDISDGLLADLGHLLGTRLRLPLEPDRLPLAPGLRAGARGLGLDPLELALAGGGDYELLFTLRGARPSAAALGRRLGVRVSELGRVVRGRAPRVAGGGGWRHF